MWRVFSTTFFGTALNRCLSLSFVLQPQWLGDTEISKGTGYFGLWRNCRLLQDGQDLICQGERLNFLHFKLFWNFNLCTLSSSLLRHCKGYFEVKRSTSGHRERKALWLDVWTALFSVKTNGEVCWIQGFYIIIRPANNSAVLARTGTGRSRWARVFIRGGGSISPRLGQWNSNVTKNNCTLYLESMNPFQV